jgi:uncharacterized protein YegL
MGWYDKILPSSWSPSRNVSNFFGDFDERWSSRSFSLNKDTEFRSKMSKILNELTRTANMITGKDDVFFKVSFASGYESGISKQSMTISPDMVIAGDKKVVDGDEYFNAMDALNGRVILGAHIRRNTDGAEFLAFSNSTNASSKKTFSCFLEHEAYNDIKDEWSGFVPYLETHRTATHANKYVVKESVPTKCVDKQEANFILLANYNMMNPDEEVKTGDAKIDSIIETFNSKVGPTFAECDNAVAWLKDQLEKTSSEDEKEKEKASGKDKEGKPDGSPSGVKSAGDVDLLSNHLKTEDGSIADLVGSISDGSSLSIQFKVKEEKIKQEFIDRAKPKYAEVVTKHRKEIKSISDCFHFQETVQVLHNRGLRTGDLDENALWKLRIDPQHIFEKKDVTKASETCVGILLDQSGSMRGEKIVEARETTIVLYESLRQLSGIKCVIMGHTAQENHRQHDLVTMIPYVTPESNNCYALALATSRLQNIDGIAIKHLAERISKVPVNGKKLMFVISDGCPAGDDYFGDEANEHTSTCIKNARKQGINVFGIGISDAYNESMGDRLYGKGNYVVLQDVKTSLKVMVNKLKQFLAK